MVTDMALYSFIEVYKMLHDALIQNGHYKLMQLHERVEKRLDNQQCRGLDGYSFFGLNLPHVVYAIESESNSVYHALPPLGFVAYQYHFVQPRSEDVIRVREERVMDSPPIQ